MAELTYEGVLELFAASDKRIEQNFNRVAEERANLQAEIAKQQAEMDKRIEKVMHDLGKRMDQNSRKIADLGSTLGRFAEEQVRADLTNKFNNWGIPVHAIANNYIQKDDNDEFIYEVDILIYNSQYVIAIEVKNTLKTDHVDEHLERLIKIQSHPMVGLHGKTLLAGVAGMIVGEGVDKYAESKGLFVLKPSGDTVKIVNNKKTFKPKEWVIK